MGEKKGVILFCFVFSPLFLTLIMQPILGGGV